MTYSKGETPYDWYRKRGLLKSVKENERAHHKTQMKRKRQQKRRVASLVKSGMQKDTGKPQPSGSLMEITSLFIPARDNLTGERMKENLPDLKPIGRKTLRKRSKKKATAQQLLHFLLGKNTAKFVSRSAKRDKARHRRKSR